MKTWLIVAVLAACTGGKAAAPKEPMKPVVQAPPPSECQAIATHIADTVMAMKDPPKTDKATIASVVGKHCDADGWSADAKKCLAAMTEATADDCGKLLTDDQNEKLMQDMLEHLPKDEHSDPGDDPPPPDSSGDPCEGGE